MNEKLLSKEQARQFAFDLYDVIIKDIKEYREHEKKEGKKEETESECA